MEDNFNLTLEDFTRICRICLSKENLIPFEGKNLRDIFRKITSIEVEQEEEKMPKNVCQNCVSKLDDMVFFTEFAQANNQTLQEILSRTEYLYSPDIPSDSESLLEDIKIKNEPSLTDKLVYSEDKSTVPEATDIEERESQECSNNSKKISCKICSEKFIDPKELRQHQRLSQECSPRKRNTNCHSCNIKFKTFKQLREHQKKNINCKVNKNRCLICGKTFEAAYKFKEHLRAHTNDTPYECKICSKKFKFAQNLKRHDKVSHKGIRPFRCDICGKVFARLERKLRHDKLHTMICGICKDVLRASEYPKHAEAHKLEGYKLEEFSCEAQYICRFCGNTFSNISDYGKHLMEHRTNGVENKKECKIKCPICNKFYVSKYGLRSHMIIHVGKKEFLCNICGKAFLKKSSLDLHSSIHTDDKPYECKDCGKTFRQQSSYNTHRLVHTGKRSYVCDICSKAFKQSTHLSRHYLIHTGEKPYKCTFCDKSFSQNCNLKTHTRTHTGETPYQCSVCSRGFHDSSSLKKHEKSHIKNE